MAKTKEELISMIENDLVDPSTNKITGERVKNALTEMVDAMGSGSGAMEYWRLPEGFKTQGGFSTYVIMLSALARIEDPDEGVQVIPLALASSDITLISAVAIDRTTKILGDGQTTTIGEMLVMMGVGDFDATGLTPMTEEEFYSVS